MSVPLILGGIILKKVVENTVGYFINKGWDKILSKNEYEEELLKVVDGAINEYKSLYPVTAEKPKFPFYDSQIFINEIIKIGLFGDMDKSLLKNELSVNANIIPPTDENLDNFLGLFITKCNSNEKLKKLHIEANYKEEVFKLSEIIGEIRASLENVINKISIELKDEWKRQINTYKKEIELFKPNTAINLLNALKEAITESEHTITPKIEAKIHYLKALCYELLQDTKNAQKEYLFCYQKDSENFTYQEKAAWAYYMLGEFDKAKIITDVILKTNFDNPTANFIASISDDEEVFCKNIQGKPDYLKINSTFKYLILLYVREKQYKSPLKHLIVDSGVTISQNVTYGNFFETLYNIEFIVFKYLTNNVFLVLMKEYSLVMILEIYLMNVKTLKLL